MTGIEAYLWFNGGNLCISSKDVEREFLLSATRWDTKASHRIKRKYITDTIEIIEPILAKIFQNW